MGMEGIAAKLFRATARLPLPEPGFVVHCLCERFAEFGQVTVEGRRAMIETGFGLVTLEDAGAELRLLAESADETGLAFAKLSMAEHLLALAACRGCPRLVWQGDGAAGAPLPYFREMQVVAARSLTPRMRRVTLRGDNLARFAHGGLHIRLLFPPEASDKPCWPVTGEDGRPQWPADAPRPEARVYTIRRIDAAAGEIDIDMVMHDPGAGGHGPGARFAAHARPGDRIGMTGPGGGSVGEAERYLLAGDETALPAIGRILETLPASAEVTAVIEVADAGEEQALPTEAKLDLRWLHRGPACAAGTTSLLPDAVRALTRADGQITYAWVGCEAQAFRAIRAHLRGEKGMARENHLVVAYWRRGFSGDEARKTE